MKITNGQSQAMKSINAPKTQAQEKTDRANVIESEKAHSADRLTQVKVSEQARQIQKAKDIASDMSVDEAKVSHLQKLIDEGKYSVDAAAIADRMVDEHFMMKS